MAHCTVLIYKLNYTAQPKMTYGITSYIYNNTHYTLPYYRLHYIYINGNISVSTTQAKNTSRYTTTSIDFTSTGPITAFFDDQLYF